MCINSCLFQICVCFTRKTTLDNFCVFPLVSPLERRGNVPYCLFAFDCLAPALFPTSSGQTGISTSLQSEGLEAVFTLDTVHWLTVYFLSISLLPSSLIVSFTIGVFVGVGIAITKAIEFNVINYQSRVVHHSFLYNFVDKF